MWDEPPGLFRGEAETSGQVQSSEPLVVPRRSVNVDRESMGLGLGVVITYQSDDRIPVTEWQFMDESEEVAETNS